MAVTVKNIFNSVAHFFTSQSPKKEKIARSAVIFDAFAYQQAQLEKRSVIVAL